MKPSVGALVLMLGLTPSTSWGEETCLMRAWESYNAKKYEQAIKFSDECISEFGKRAASQQSRVKVEPPVGVVPDQEKATIYSRGLLNDVATAAYVKGRSAEALAQGLDGKRYRRLAEEAYATACEFKHGRTWDPKGWFWSPCTAARDRLPLPAAAGSQPGSENAKDDKLGLSALEFLIERVSVEHPLFSGTGLNIQLNTSGTGDERVYYFFSGFEIFTTDGAILKLSVYGYNQHLFHVEMPELNNFSAITLLANFPILPEVQPKIIHILESHPDNKVKVVLTIALRDTPTLLPETIEFLSRQLTQSNGDLRAATLLALVPRITDLRYIFMSNFDLEPILKALSDLLDTGISSSSALMIEALLSRGHYLTYFGILGTGAATLVGRTARVPPTTPFEEAARQHFRDIILR